MLLFAALALYSLSPTADSSPSCYYKCQCRAGDSSVSCEDLSEKEFSELTVKLSEPVWNDLRRLSIRRSSGVSLQLLPPLTLLEDIDLSNNGLRDSMTSQRRFPMVRKVVLNGNNFTTVERSLLYPFPAIEELFLDDNQISTFGYNALRMPSLRIISLSGNRIQNLGIHVFRYIPLLHEINLGHNLIDKFVLSDFTSISALRTLLLNGNNISEVECDSTSSMNSMEKLDLSDNRLTTVPGTQIRYMESLRELILSGNPIKVLDGRLTLDNLEIFELSSSSLHIIEAFAFARLNHLHTVRVNNNKQLVYISPRALGNVTIFSLDVSNSAVEFISPALLQNVARANLMGNPLDCGCMLSQMGDITSTTIQSYVNTTCTSRTGKQLSLRELSADNLSVNDKCDPQNILPFATRIEATVGETLNVYCAANNDAYEVYWKTPQGSHKSSIPENTSGLPRLDYFTSTLFEPKSQLATTKRVYATTEFFHIDVVLPTDEGNYECIVKEPGYVSSRSIELVVHKPNIEIVATHVGVSSVHLAWNQNLNVEAVDRVALHVNSSSDDDFQRTVLLSLSNIYCSYNLINLLPDKVYNICLRWVLTDDGSEIYGSCVSEKTERIKTILEELGPEGIAILLLIVSGLILYFFGQCIYNRLHVYATTKKQSKLIQSISGQSMLSHSISHDSTTYENHAHQSVSMSGCRRNDASSTGLLQSEDV